VSVSQDERSRMTVSRKSWVGTLIVVLLLTSCKPDRIRPEQIERGGEWLSWTPNERNEYVYGYLDGYLMGRNRACAAADKLFEVGQPHRLGDDQHPTEVPSGRCLAALDNYSRAKYNGSPLDFSVYTNPITEFYTKHPEYLGIPFPFLMEFLSDEKCTTADQLYQQAREGRLHVIR